MTVISGLQNAKGK